MNMTGDPNQQNGANLFTVNYNFGTAANPADWTKFPNQSTSNVLDASQYPKPVNFGTTAFQQPFDSVNFSNLSFPSTQNVPNSMEHVSFTPLTSYCFGTGDNRPQAPVQFPFPVAPPADNTVGGDFGGKSLHIPLRCKRKTDSPP